MLSFSLGTRHSLFMCAYYAGVSKFVLEMKPTYNNSHMHEKGSMELIVLL